MLSILDLTKTNKLVLATFVFLAILIFGSGRAHAATLAVDSNCTLNEAITAMNTPGDGSGCVKTGAAYGTADTINIPAGTFVLTADAGLQVPVIIQGAGMGQTIIDGDSGSYIGFDTDNNLTIRDLKVTAFRNSAISAKTSNVILDHVEVDGQDAFTSGGNIYGIQLQGPSAGGASSIVADNVYVHNISAANQIHGFIIALGGSSPGDMTVTLTNTTIADLHSSGLGVNTLMISAGLYGGTAGGTITSTVDNTTLNDISAADTASGFGTFGWANNGQTIGLHTTVRNATVTGISGSSSVYIAQSPAFFSAGAANAGGTVTVVEEVQNSLIANNATDTVPTNCYSGDLSANFGGSGSTVNASIISNGHNLSDDNSCTDFTATGDQQNVGNIISTLGPLQNNGGDVPTRALLAGSPAISAGSSVLGIATDARGVARPNSCPSVGAFQFEGAVCGASTPSASGGSNAGAPNTGVGSVAQILNVLASMLGIGLLAYVFRKQQRSS